MNVLMEKDAQGLAVWLGENGVPASVCEIFEGTLLVPVDAYQAVGGISALYMARTMHLRVHNPLIVLTL